MAEQKAIGCGKPTGSVVGAEAPTQPEAQSESRSHEEVPMSKIMVGRKAPDFTAPAYRNGGFEEFKLSDLLGRWVLVCFYPGDFTFV
jgi:peroxiredoxin (alkyl hydroperoxide reductase subunit C)